VFANFKNLNRELTKAYLRQMETQGLFSKAKGGALPEHQIKVKQQDDETFEKVSGLFDQMLKSSRYSGQNPSVMNSSNLLGSTAFSANNVDLSALMKSDVAT
jgi:hypothetical protein